MRFLSLGEIVDLHQLLLEQTGGSPGIRDAYGQITREQLTAWLEQHAKRIGL